MVKLVQRKRRNQKQVTHGTSSRPLTSLFMDDVMFWRFVIVGAAFLVCAVVSGVLGQTILGVFYGLCGLCWCVKALRVVDEGDGQ